jgi:hypothetical protein
MKFKSLLIRFALIIFFWGFNLTIAMSQCAMCKATAESARDEYGNSISGGINTGIVYMMGMPYLLLAILGWVFYKDRIKGFVKDFMNIHN